MNDLRRALRPTQRGWTDPTGTHDDLERHANNYSLWLIAKAISEILPDGDKGKQLMQRLLNQKEGLVEATWQGTFFRA